MVKSKDKTLSFSPGKLSSSSGHPVRKVVVIERAKELEVGSNFPGENEKTIEAIGNFKRGQATFLPFARLRRNNETIGSIERFLILETKSC